MYLPIIGKASIRRCLVAALILSVACMYASLSLAQEPMPREPASTISQEPVLIVVTVVSYLVTAFVVAFALATFLHCVYDLALRGLLQRPMVESFLDSSHELDVAEPTKIPSDALALWRETMKNVSSRAKSWPLAPYTLPSAQLCGQISAWFDLAIAGVLDKPNPPEIKEQLASRLRGWAERTLDVLQVSLARRWKVVDFAVAFFLLVTIFVLAGTSGVDMPLVSRGARAGTILIQALTPSLFVALLVPQFRPWIERWMLRR